MAKFDGLKINESECFQAISAKLGTSMFEIVNFKQEPLEEMGGYLGEHSILKIAIKRESLKQETLSFFVKSLPQVQSQRDFLNEMNGSFKEYSFFTKYIDCLKKLSINILDDVIPTCYLATDESFIFEDLSAKNFQTLQSRKALDINTVKVGLSSLAKLHASAIIFEEKTSFRLARDFSEELKESFYLGTESTERAMRSCKRGNDALIDIIHDERMKITKDQLKDKVRESVDLQKIYIQPSTKFRNTICHGDTWTKNFLFKFEKGQAVSCVIVDFQTYRYGPPGQDVMLFLHLVMDRETRNENIQKLISFYYEELNRNFRDFDCENIITWNEFLESCHFYKQYALTQTIMHFHVVILRDDIAKEVFGTPGYAKNALFGNGRYEYIIETCQRDPVFKRLNLGALEDLTKFYHNQLLL